jgi:hypothetical protein
LALLIVEESGEKAHFQTEHGFMLCCGVGIVVSCRLRHCSAPKKKKTFKEVQAAAVNPGVTRRSFSLPSEMPPMAFTGIVTKVGAMNKTATVTVSRWIVHKTTGKVSHRNGYGPLGRS